VNYTVHRGNGNRLNRIIGNLFDVLLESYFFLSVYTISSENNVSTFNISIFSGGIVNLVDTYVWSNLKFQVVFKAQGKTKQ